MINGEHLESFTLKELEALEISLKTTLVKIDTAKKNLSKESSVCVICFSNEKNMLFIPCGHLSSCDECSVSLKNCPICRVEIQQKIKAFIS